MRTIFKIGVYGKNKKYLEKLIHCLEEDVRLQLFIFTKEDEVDKFLSDKDLDGLIIDDGVELQKEIEVNKKIYLSNKGASENTVYKYQSSRVIKAQLLKLLGIENFDAVKESNCKIVGVYSPVANSFKTSLAVLLGYQNLEEGNTILLTLDKFSLLDCSKNYNEIYDLSDLLYCLGQGRCDEKVFEKAIGYLSELPYIYPLITPEDLYKITAKQIGKFIETISNKCQRIIIDIGNDVINMIEFLDLCEEIYMPVIEDGYSDKKVKYFENYLKGRERDDILNKIEKIEIPSKLLTRKQWNVNYYNELKWCDFKICS